MAKQADVLMLLGIMFKLVLTCCGTFSDATAVPAGIALGTAGNFLQLGIWVEGAGWASMLGCPFRAIRAIVPDRAGIRCVVDHGLVCKVAEVAYKSTH